MLPKYKQNKNSSLKKTWGLLLTTWTINFFVWLKKERKKEWKKNNFEVEASNAVIQSSPSSKQDFKKTEKLEAAQCPPSV